MELNSFDTISLNETGKVQLMNRVDRKFWFSIQHLPDLLESLNEEYFILCIEGEEDLPYQTNYYDTVANHMYLSHHNGKLNRIKIRKRCYLKSGISFLEIKTKNNKGRTFKKRIPTDFKALDFNPEEKKFIEENTPFCSDDLHPKLQNRFKRITLVNKNFTERCTIDTNLVFSSEQNGTFFDKLVIAEVKSDKGSSWSQFIYRLNHLRLKSSGFSKYCIGRTIIDSSLKTNGFKAKIRRINKIAPSENFTIYN